MIKKNKTITLKRSQINLADYNPRRITAEARKLLKKNLETVGLMGGIIWNKTTGNLVSGHQRLSLLDKDNKYKPATDGNPPENDYELEVVEVELSIEDEKKQNIFLNNQNAQGMFDTDKLKVVMEDIKFDEDTGFSKKQSMSIFGIASALSQEEYEEITKQVEAITSTFKDMHNSGKNFDDFFIVLVCKNTADKQLLVDSLDLQLDENRFIKAEDFINAITEANGEEE